MLAGLLDDGRALRAGALRGIAGPLPLSPGAEPRIGRALAFRALYGHYRLIARKLQVVVLAGTVTVFDNGSIRYPALAGVTV